MGKRKKANLTSVGDGGIQLQAGANNSFTISPDWEFTKTQTSDKCIFTFHPSEKFSCHGFVLEITNWRIRPSSPASQDQPPKDDNLLQAVNSALIKVLGSEAFRESARVLEHAEGKLKHMPAELQKYRRVFPALSAARSDVLLKAMNDKFTSQARQDFADAWEHDLLSPPVALLSIPLLTLTNRYQRTVILGNVPWTSPVPPSLLIHLSDKGFDSRSNTGILACTSPNAIHAGLWIVSGFSPCAVELKYDRKAAILEDFPQVSMLSDIGTNIEGIWNTIHSQGSVHPATKLPIIYHDPRLMTFYADPVGK